MSVMVSNIINSPFSLLISCLQLKIIMVHPTQNSPASLLLRATTTSSKKLSAAELAKRDGPWPECVWMTGTECTDHIRSFVEKDAHVFQLMDDLQ